MAGWFSVDKEGLGKVLARRGGDGSVTGAAWLLFELVQNSLDAGAKTLTCRLEPVKGRPFARLYVEDDGEGFCDLRHAFVLFAESPKKSDPTKGGRFDVGEKLVLSLCEEAVVTSTKGSVVFDRDGSRRETKEKIPRGTIFRGLVRLTREEADVVRTAAELLLPPDDVELTLDGKRIASREVVGRFRASLATEIGDEEGRLRRVRRETEARLYATRPGETSMLYELGIPIVELGGGEPWHVDIRQRIPLNIDRDNVTPAYLRELRVHLLNHEHAEVRGEEAATRGWVRDAAASPEAKSEAVAHVLTERFGERRVAQDPSDPEGTKLAVAAGYTVVPGGSLSKGEWENARRDGLLPRAGSVTPSTPERSEKSRPIPADEWTAGMRHVALLASDLANLLLGRPIRITMSEAPGADVIASWTEAEQRMDFNVARLGPGWFEKGPTVAQVDLILHELAHAVVRGDHLSKVFNDACTGLGARLVFYVLDHPEWMRERVWTNGGRP